MYIKPTANAKDTIFDVIEDAYVIPKSDVPCPWDAGVEIKDGNVIMEGNLQPGGPSGGAVCTVVCPIQEFSKYYDVEVPNDTENVDSILEEQGWTKA